MPAMQPSAVVSRRTVLQRFAPFGLVVAGLPLLAGCDRSAPAAREQPPGRVYRIGWLAEAEGEPGGQSSPINWSIPIGPTTRHFLARLTELGYVEGHNLHWEFRRAPTPDLLAVAAAALVAQRVELIVTLAAPRATRAAFATPGATPVVMSAGSSDPVADGYAQSLGRPGGKVTGVTYVRSSEFGPKRLEVLKEALPALTRLGVLFDTSNDLKVTREASRAELAPTAQQLGFALVDAEVSTQEELEGAVATLAAAGAQAVFPITRASWTGVNMMARLSQAALGHGLPLMGLNRLSADAGALIGYAPDAFVLYARAADYVDKILRGTRPADLPIEQPTAYELSLNLVVADALGLAIPPAVINRAPVVIR